MIYGDLALQMVGVLPLYLHLIGNVSELYARLQTKSGEINLLFVFVNSVFGKSFKSKLWINFNTNYRLWFLYLAAPPYVKNGYLLVRCNGGLNQQRSAVSFFMLKLEQFDILQLCVVVLANGLVRFLALIGRVISFWGRFVC